MIKTIGVGLTNLLDPLAKAIDLAEQLPELEKQAELAVEAEKNRLIQEPWKLVQSSPLLDAMLSHRSPEVYTILKRRVMSGSKGVAKQALYVWEMIDRAVTKNTPRDWHGHVALCFPQSENVNSQSWKTQLTATADFATEWVENFHEQRRRLAISPLDEAAGDTQIMLTPLRSETDDLLNCWVVDPEDRDHLTEVQLKRSEFLIAICAPLGGALATLDELQVSVVPEGDEGERQVLRKFLEHLTRMGVTEISKPLKSQVNLWQPIRSIIESNVQRPPGDLSKDQSPGDQISDLVNGFLDVYRKVQGGFVPPILELQHDVEQMTRVLEVINADQRQGLDGNNRGGQVDVGEQPQSVLDLMRRGLEVGEGERGHRRPPRHWPTANNSDSVYGNLLKWIDHGSELGEPLHLTKDVLDELGTPLATINWPIDCVLRLASAEAGFPAVFDEVFPAGSLDARMVSMLSRLYRTIPHVEAYRRFLRQIEIESGVTFVELLIPPLSVGAANAVRRPMYTSAWTGDTDIEAYIGRRRGVPGDKPLRYIPLDSITLRRVGNRVVAEVDGQPICPMYHATRLPLPPWDKLANMLLSTTPLPMAWSPRRLDILLEAFPSKRWMPRVTVSNGLILSPAQWRVDTSTLIIEGVSTLADARSLERARRRLGLPRWVFVHDYASLRAYACDLESIRSLPILDYVSKAGDGEFLVSEMVPSPDFFPMADVVHDADDRLGSSLMLRLPANESPDELAARVAPVFSSLHDA
ncbi:MAG: lantibiotic dehydratase [Chloroflexi bacterium]|nr:lantibiotic dehydratase [Chloroflexota bacterium]